jgi:hypothetical protein
MWSAVEWTKDHSSCRKLASAESVEALKSMQSVSSSDGDVMYYWDAPFPTAPGELQRVYDEMVAANGGIEFRVIVGGAITRTPGAQSASCSGSCYCVVQGNKRECQYCYQGAGGAICNSCHSSC